MPVGARKDPFRNFRFKLEIDGIVQGGFSEVTIPDSSSDVIEYREGIDPPTPRKLPGMNKYGNVTLKWGISDSVELYENWRKLVEEGKMAAARKNVARSIRMMFFKPMATNRTPASRGVIMLPMACPIWIIPLARAKSFLGTSMVIEAM